MYEFDKPLIQKIDSIIDDCKRDCHHNFFHTFDHFCEYGIQLTNITNNEIINITISDKSMALFELSKKLTVVRQNGFIFNQINKLTIKIYTNLSHKNIHYYLQLRIPIMHRHFIRELSENRGYIQTHCNDRRNPFHFACRKWYLFDLYNNMYSYNCKNFTLYDI